MTARDEHGVRTEDLVAYAEGRLPAGSGLRARVERHLRDNPGSAQRVRQFRHQDELIREAFGPVAAEPLPEHLVPGRSRKAHDRWYAAPGIAAALLIGIAIGWTAAGLAPEAHDRPAIRGFVERVGERLAEVPATAVQGEETVDAIASGNGPNLDAAGLQLIGGTDSPEIEADVFRFDYRDTAGNTIHLFVARDIAPALSSIRTLTVDDRLLAYWHLGDSTYVLGGQVGDDRLVDIARRVRELLGDLPKRVQLDALDVARSGALIAVNPDSAEVDQPGNPADIDDAIDAIGKRGESIIIGDRM